MRLFVTAGNTQTDIDQVRCITNIFTGRTGTAIARDAASRGHHVTLATSHPDLAPNEPRSGFVVLAYRTYQDLEAIMAREIASGVYDAVVHVAAVSDYHLAGVYPNPGAEPISAGKIKSTYSELWLKLVPTAKLVDKIRSDWQFRGRLVKFKLEVGVSDAELLEIAEASRLKSQADLICANTLGGYHDWAYLGASSNYRRIARAELPGEILQQLEAFHLN